MSRKPPSPSRQKADIGLIGRTRRLAALGSSPEQEATYLNYGGEHNPRVCYRATYPVPENRARVIDGTYKLPKAVPI